MSTTTDVMMCFRPELAMPSFCLLKRSCASVSSDPSPRTSKKSFPATFSAQLTWKDIDNEQKDMTQAELIWVAEEVRYSGG